MDTSDTDSDDILKDVELQVLNEKIQGLSKNTISSYLRSYSQLRAALDKEVHLSSQKLIMETAQQLSNNLNTQAALINIGIIMRKLYALEVKELEMKRKQNKKGITQYTQEQNEKIGSTLPTLAEFDAHIDLLYSQNRFPEFLVNFLIRHLQVLETKTWYLSWRPKKQMSRVMAKTICTWGGGRLFTTGGITKPVRPMGRRLMKLKTSGF
jgi:hypothetical protein